MLLATLKLPRFAKHLTQITKQVLLWVPKIEWVRREIARDYGCTQKQRAPREQDCLSHVLLIDNPNLGGVRFRRDALNNAIGYAIHRSRSHDVVIRVRDDAGNVHRDARAYGRVQGVVKYFLASHRASH